MNDVKKDFSIWLLVATQEKNMVGAQSLIYLVLELKVCFKACASTPGYLFSGLVEQPSLCPVSWHHIL